METFEFKVRGRYMLQASSEEEARREMKEKLDNTFLDWEEE